MKQQAKPQLSMRIPPDLADWIEREAEINRRTKPGQAIWAMEQTKRLMEQARQRQEAVQ